MIDLLNEVISPSRKLLVSLLILTAASHSPASADAPKTCREFQFTLNNAVESALVNNREVVIAKAQIAKQQALAAETDAGNSRSVAINNQYYKIQDSRVPVFQGQKVGPDYSWLASVDATQPIYNAGRSGADQEEQNLVIKSLEEDVHKIVNDTIAIVKEKFFDALKARDLAALYTNSFVGSDADKEAGIADAQDALDISLAELNRIATITRMPTSCLTPVGELKHEIFNVDLKNSIDDAKERRPEMKKWRNLKQSTFASEKSARAGYYPSLSALASYGGESAVLEDTVGGEIHGWTVGVKANWDIFDSHLTDARVRESLADRQIYEANQQAAEEDVSLEVRKAEVELRAADRAVTYLELQRTKGADQAFENQLGRVEALHRYNVAKVKLERAIAVDPQ